MGRRRVICILLIVIVVVASFVFLDFGISKNETKLEGYPREFLLGTPQVKPNLLIYVEDGVISNALRGSLVQGFSNVFLDVELTGRALEKYDAQVLIVEYSKASVLYTPFYSNAQIELNMTFSSNGDVSWRLKTGLSLNTSLNTAWYKVRMVLDDQAYGVMSLKHYYNYLAQRFADSMKGRIEKILDYLHIKFKNHSLTAESFMINVLLRWAVVGRSEF
jgi:hypothetical protein